MPNKGFSIIEVVISMSIMSVLALGMGTLITNQSRSLIQLEDRLSKVDLKRTIEQVLSYSDACKKSFQNKNMSTGVVNNLSLKDQFNNPQISTGDNFDRLKVNNIKLQGNPIVANALNNVDLVIQLADILGMVFKPLTFPMSVNLNAARTITDCSFTGASNIEFQWMPSCTLPWVSMGLYDCDSGDGQSTNEDSCSNGGTGTWLCYRTN
jgi:prepilin-type N-terminal cleavage/methylation domain-containing protein